MALFHSHRLVILSRRKQCWQQQCLFIALNIVLWWLSLPRTVLLSGGSNCLLWYKTNNQPGLGWSQVERLHAQRAGCHTSQHMALTYLNDWQQGQMCWELLKSSETFIKVRSKSSQELLSCGETALVQCNCLPGNDLIIIITIFHGRILTSKSPHVCDD